MVKPIIYGVFVIEIFTEQIFYYMIEIRMYILSILFSQSIIGEEK